MAQLRQDYAEFSRRQAEIVVVGPEDAAAFTDYWQKHDLPFIGLPDPMHTVADLYGQEVKLLKFGRMPALVVIDKQGMIQHSHYGNSMADIASNSEILALLDRLNQAQNRSATLAASVRNPGAGSARAAARPA